MEEVREQTRLEAPASNWRIVTITVDLVNDPRNLRAERQRKARAQQRRAARRRKRLRTLCGWLSALSLIAAFCCVGWIEGGRRPAVGHHRRLYLHRPVRPVRHAERCHGVVRG